MVVVLFVALAAVRPVVVAPRLAVVATGLAALRTEVAVPFTAAFEARAGLVPARPADRAVVVAPRLAVLETRFVALRADVAVPLAAALAAPAVLDAPRPEARAVPCAPPAAVDPVVRTRRTVRSPSRPARRVAAIALSVTSEAPERTRVATVRATLVPRGDERGFLWRRTRATTSPTAVTPP